MSKIKIEKPTKDQLDSMGVFSWPIWTKEASTFPWSYDEQETCYLLEGQVKVKQVVQQINIRIRVVEPLQRERRPLHALSVVPSLRSVHWDDSASLLKRDVNSSNH